jgi:hypothetical protein
VGTVIAREARAMIALLTLFTATATASGPHASAARVESLIQLDGDGADAAWRAVSVSEHFVQYDPDEGHAASEPTRFKIAYDDEAIYVLVEAIDSSPDQIRGQLTRRDAQSPSDWIHLWLDTRDDRRTAYRFSVNPEGVQQDARVVDAQNEDPNWDAVWEVATKTSTAGWAAEFRIPFSQLRYDRAHERWGLQVRRDLSRNNELAYFSPVPKTSDRLVRHFGALEGLDELPATWGLGARPYLRASAGEDLSMSAGGDATIGLGSALTLSLTLNPDFAQVEADPSQLNLSPSEIFLEEKRPFFLEAKDILSFPLAIGDGGIGRQTLFYTRRIGETPILGAAQLAGKTSDGWAIGVLEAVTDRDEETPRMNAIVARVSRDFDGGESTVGAIATHAIHDLESADAHSQLHQALSGGVDLDQGFGEYRLIARAFATNLQGSSSAIEAVEKSSVHYFQRPDAAHLGLSHASSLSGYGLTLVGGKLSGAPFRGAAGVMIQSPGFDANVLGYTPRADQQLGVLWLQYRDDTRGALHHRYQVNLNLFASRTFGGEITGLDGNVNFSWTLPSYHDLYAGVGRNLEALDPTMLRGGPAFLSPGGVYGWLGGKTDVRNPWVAQLELFGGKADDDAGGQIGGKVTFSVRPAPSVELSVAPSLSIAADDRQYFDTEPDRILIAALDQTTASITVRAAWTIRPELTLELYAAPYLSAGEYGQPRRVTDPKAADYADRSELVFDRAPERFLFAELRSNLVARWEYAPGSTVYLVWTHAQSETFEDRGRLELGRDLADLVRLPSSDAVTVKLSHWFAI